MLYLQDYAREAVESGDEGNDFRNKAAVHFDKNKVELAKIFDAIAGKDEVISKEEFKNFWQDLFAQGEISNDNMTKITGEILNKYVNEKLVEQGEMPTFRKTDDEIEFMNKEMQLKELNVKIDPNLVKEIKYSEGGDIAFLILDDDTEIQFQKEAYIGSGGDGELNITKNEEGRYIIFSNKDRKCNTIIGKIAKIIPSENSKITLLNPKNIVYSSPGEIDDDVIIEGKAFGVDLIVGSGDDKIVNNTKSGVKIIKHFENDSVELQKKNDIAYTHVRNSETKNFYYSPQDDYVLARQMEDFDNFLQKATDGELIALANENGLEKFANEYNSVTSIEGEATSLTKKQRENLIKEIKSQQEKYFKDINKEAAKIEKEAEKAEKKAKKQ